MQAEVLSNMNNGENAPVKREPKKDNLGRSYGTGRRKESVARVWIKPGSGKFEINGKSLTDYFTRSVLQVLVMQQFEKTNRTNMFDVWCTVKGGVLSGQAGALRHGISRALNDFEPELHSELKQAGLLTRDSRSVERKKYGRMKARRRFQFSKR